MMREFIWRALYFVARIVSKRPRCSILLYHSVSGGTDPLAVTPVEFEQQMRFIREHFDVIPLERAVAVAAGEAFSRDCVAVTFDDGYRDFVTVALPILEQYRVPATVFVLGGEPDRAALGTTYELIRDADTPALMKPLVCIGSHGLTHRKLTRLTQEELSEELERSRANLQERYGSGAAEFIAYPKGSFNDRVVQTAAVAGYAGGVTVTERAVRVGDDRFALPRIQVTNGMPLKRFAAKLSIAADWYYAIWHIAHRRR